MSVSRATRDELLAIIRTRITDAMNARDPGWILSPDSLRAEEALLEAAGGVADLPVANILGWLHWLRYQALPSGEDQVDLQIAVTLFLKVAEINPDLVPAAVRDRFLPRDTADDPATLTRRGIEALSQYQRSGDLAAIRAATGFMRAAVAGIPAEHPERCSGLNNLGTTLRTWFEVTGDMDALAEAITVHQAAVAATADDYPRRAEYLDNLGVVLRAWYERTGDEAALTDAIAVHREASAHGGHKSLSHLSVVLYAQYERTQEMATLTEAIALVRAALAAAPDGEPEKDRDLNNLGSCLMQLFERTGDMAYLTDAIAAFRAAVAATSEDQPERSRYLYSLGHALNDLFDQSGNVAALREAVVVYRSAIAAAPDGQPDKAGRLAILGSLLRTLATRTGDLDALTEAIAVLRAALAADPGDPARGLLLDLLGRCLRACYESTGDLDALTEAVAVHRAALARARDDRRAQFQDSLGSALLYLYRHTRNPDVLAEAITLMRAGIADSPPDDPRRGGRLSNLGLALLDLGSENGALEVLAEAVEVMRAAVSATTDDGAERTGALGKLATALRLMFDRTGEMSHLTEAVALGRAAVAATPEGDPDLAENADDLGRTLRTFFERTGDLDSLAEAITLTRSALATTPDDSPRAARYLHDLGADLRSWYEWTGDIAVLREALDTARAALAATTDEDPDRAVRLNSLGVILQLRYRGTGDLESLTEAVAVHRAAVDAPEGRQLNLAVHLSNLGLALEELAERLADPDVLAEAITAHRGAVSAAPDRVMSLGNLGIALLSRYRMTGEQDALTEAVSAHRAALASTADDHPDRTLFLHNLGSALRYQAEIGTDPELLAEAIAVGRAAVETTPGEHPDRAGSLLTLAAVLLARWFESSDPDVFAEVNDVLTAAAGSATAPVRVRVNAGMALARITDRVGEHRAALAMMETVIGLLPMMAPRDLTRRDREHWLGEMPGIGAQAAAVAISAGDPARAVELLEQARGVLLAETMGPRAELARLHASAPELARELAELRDRLAVLSAPQQTATTASDEGLGRQVAEQRRQAASQWDDLLRRIRVREGLAGFLAVPPIDTLRQQAREGPVVLVTADFARGDALILADSDVAPVRHVPLPGLDERSAEEQANRFHAAQFTITNGVAGLDALDEAQAGLCDVLGWLWDTVAEPVLAKLGYSAAPSSDTPWPRIWWCPVGIMTYLPLHAAGHHEEVAAAIPDPRTVLDRVISSYTPTIRALEFARRRRDRSAAAGRTVLIVAEPNAPGAAELPGVAAETRLLRDLLPAAEILAGPGATRQAVVDALPRHNCAHFACHGVSDRTDPASGRLLLHDHQENPLTVAAISSLDLASAELAYLSACSTTDTSPGLADEAIHITGAFQLAGYRHVIGTLWPISDDAATRIAADVYASLTDNGRRSPDSSRTAHSLHQAVRSLRAEFPAMVFRWAAYVHFGA
jgi:tetratricopeptide (TPR) repeat protein